MPLTDEQRAAICTAARSYLGVKWVGQGRDHDGIDCVGVVECSYIEAGLPLPPTLPVYRNVDSKLLKHVLFEHWRPISRKQAKAADVVMYGVPWEAHVALLVPSPSKLWPLNAVHCPLNRKVVEARFDIARGDVRDIYTWR